MHDTRAFVCEVSLCLGENDNVRSGDVLACLLAFPSQSDIFGFNIYTQNKRVRNSLVETNRKVFSDTACIRFMRVC